MSKPTTRVSPEVALVVRALHLACELVEELTPGLGIEDETAQEAIRHAARFLVGAARRDYVDVEAAIALARVVDRLPHEKPPTDRDRRDGDWVPQIAVTDVGPRGARTSGRSDVYVVSVEDMGHLAGSVDQLATLGRRLVALPDVALEHGGAA